MKRCFCQQFRLNSAEETTALAGLIAPRLRAGDVILLQGGLGAGKTHFARGVIQARLANEGRAEDVPSPTFTLVQTYEVNNVEIWHSDLYRLTGPDNVVEIGLDDAFETAICLVEWPDRLGFLTPGGALEMRFELTDQAGQRILTIASDDSRWRSVFAGLEQADG